MHFDDKPNETILHMIPCPYPMYVEYHDGYSPVVCLCLTQDKDGYQSIEPHVLDGDGYIANHDSSGTIVLVLPSDVTMESGGMWFSKAVAEEV